MADLRDRNILVVGASGAFGSEFAAQLQAAGATVFGTASNDDSFQRLAGSLAGRLTLDLADQGSVERFANNIAATEIDGVILASGEVAFGTAAETPAAITERLMRVNFLGQVAVVAALLPTLEKSAAAGRSPFVVSISGVIAETPMAGLSSYSASKTALHGYATAATRELRRAGIRWLDARPGHTESGLADRAIFGQAPAFGAGLQTHAVVARILQALVEDEKDLPSTAFNVAVA